MKKLIQRQLREAASLHELVVTDAALAKTVVAVSRKLVEVYRKNGKVLIAGNGGSAADAQHWAGELVARFYFDRPALSAIALSTNTSILTAIGNDSGYEMVFARQVEAYGRAGDLFMGISTSGNAGNVIKALETARAGGLFTVGFTGKTGGRMAVLCDICIKAPAEDTPRIQEIHALLGHVICAAVESTLFAKA
ncbi:MAG: D-sedoheptulose 7-phosphate isomerase [Lentisphaerae bacterium]|nr:D-sedoheptulose 7-phosphate isomerase [Lentisphaerota bacterium]